MPAAPPWKRLVEELKDEGYESVYLERLRARLDPSERQELLEKEIVQEMAQALGRAQAKVDYALLRLERAGRALEAEVDGAARAALSVEWDALREEAERARRDLLIHREAIGIRRNDVLFELFPIPPPRHRRGEEGASLPQRERDGRVIACSKSSSPS